MKLKEMATSTLIFTASQKSLIHQAKTDITIDLPAFDFSVKPSPTLVRLHQEDTASTTVKVKLLGAACQSPRPITLSLDPSSLPSIISYNISSSSVVPPGESTISFKSESGPDIGLFKAMLVGCCASDNMEKTLEIGIDVLFPNIPVTIPEEGHSFDEMKEGGVRVDSLENISKRFQLPLDIYEKAKKDIKDEATKGYVEISEEEALKLKRSKSLARPMNQIIGLLTFDPTSLNNTSFESLRLEGGYPDNGVMDGRGEITYSEVIRVFTMPNGAIVQLSERDFYSSGGEGGVIAREVVNENVNGFPAALTVQQSQSGNAITTIGWDTTGTAYTLMMEGNVRENGQYGLFRDLARSIPVNKSEVSRGRRNRDQGSLPSGGSGTGNDIP